MINSGEKESSSDDSKKSLQCSICYAKFNSINGLRGHKALKHEEKGYECDFCSVKFFAKNALKLHVQVLVSSFVAHYEYRQFLWLSQ